jgi:UDP-3-O-[3-hydroxymyristoyl] glucosamine N-acyltransferase
MTLQELRTEFSDATADTWHQHPHGGGWVENTASVADSVYVGPNAVVSGYARAQGRARICDHAWVYGTACISGEAQIFGNAWVGDQAQVCERAWVYDNARVAGNARLSGGMHCNR